MPTRGRAAALSIALEEDIETYIVAPALRARQLRPWYCVIQGGAHPTKKPQGLRCGPELQPFGLTPYLTTSRNRARKVTWARKVRWRVRIGIRFGRGRRRPCPGPWGY